MLSGNNIFVPTYHRAYSTGNNYEDERFFENMQYYAKRHTARYYFGLFLFEEKDNRSFAVVDGQKRLTTIIIFISAIYSRLNELTESLSEDDQSLYSALVKDGETYRFSTVDYDNQLFRDYVINKVKTDHNGLDNESQNCIVAVYDYFVSQLKEYDNESLHIMLDTVVNATCIAHTVKDEAEASLMIEISCDEESDDTTLDMAKGVLLRNIHLYCTSEDERTEVVSEVSNRFELIYRSMSKIEGYIKNSKGEYFKLYKEGELLRHAYRVFVNDLTADGIAEGLDNELCEADSRINFIRRFTHSIADSFEQMAVFLHNVQTDFTAHALWTVGYEDIILPFIIKAYSNGVSDNDFRLLAKALTSIHLRKILTSGGELDDMLRGVFKNFKGDVHAVVNHIEWMKTTTDRGLAYWNNVEFKRVLEGNFAYMYHIRFILWLYENHLREQGKSGYGLKRFDAVKESKCGRIAPQTENQDPNSGYCKYDDEFKESYLNCLGNYVLVSGDYNEDAPFEAKRSTFTELLQQQEIRDMTERDHLWDKAKIAERKKRIVDFMMATF